MALLHPAIKAGNTAAISGAGSLGIGHSLALALGSHGLNLSLFDVSSQHLTSARSSLISSGVSESRIHTVVGDVSSPSDNARWAQETKDKFGKVHYLSLNAGTSKSPLEGLKVFGEEGAKNFEETLKINLFGIIYGGAAFVEGIKEHGEKATVVITGSKQGITAPPGNAPYNVSKAGVKAYAEALAHTFRNTAPQVSAHLLVPGWTFTKLTNPSGSSEKPAGAWTPDQVVEYLLPRQAKDEFYIICPDNDVTEALDKGRMAWSATDPVDRRSALSRWDPKYKDEFEAHMKKYA